MSCSQGARRRRSRTKARKLFTVADLAQQMHGKAWLNGRSDLVEIMHTLHQALHYKGI